MCEFGAKIQRESSYCETKGEWIFALENLEKILENSGALVSYISNSMRKLCRANKMWGCVWATRSLHDEVPGIWFTSWPLFFLFFLQLLLTLLLLYFSYIYPSSSSIVAVLIAKAGHIWVSWPEARVSIVFLIANTATVLLLSENRSAYAQAQLISTKERRSALTLQTRPPVTFLIWQ